VVERVPGAGRPGRPGPAAPTQAIACDNLVHMKRELALPSRNQRELQMRGKVKFAALRSCTSPPARASANSALQWTRRHLHFQEPPPETYHVTNLPEITARPRIYTRSMLQ